MAMITTAQRGSISRPSSEIIPLDSPLRVEPIHPSVPEIKLPSVTSSTSPSSNRNTVTENASSGTANADDNTSPPHPSTLNPLTLQLFTTDELRGHGFDELKALFVTSPNGNTSANVELAQKAREEAVAELRNHLEENQRRKQDVERQMEEKEKTREFERKVYMKKLGKDGG